MVVSGYFSCELYACFHYFCHKITLKMLFRITFLVLVSLSNCVEVSRPRGVPLTKKVFYDPEKDFICIDGTTTMPFTYVNDDFCDCPDGSDEPGTSACPNGMFHCTNAGHKPSYIPSSRVNDNVCDCCDATDEYNSSIQCTNSCRDLGRQAREEAARLAEILTKGHQTKQQLSAEGKRRKEERKSKLDELTQLRDAAKAFLQEKEIAKAAIEEAEKAALEKYKSEEEEKKKFEDEKERQQKDKIDAQEAFTDLDSNQDERITIDEIKGKWVFDSNKDGEITDEEAKFFLNGKDELDREAFSGIGWMLMKPHYSMLRLFKGPGETEPESESTVITGEVEEIDRETATATTADVKPEAPIEGGEEQTEDDDTEDDDNEDDDEDEEAEVKEEGPAASEETTASSPYDEETQLLIDAANTARTEFEEANRKLGDLDKEIKDVEQVLDIDFGEDDQFAPMYSQCFEHEDREYIYKLCLFDLVSQRPKSGGSDINLGRWQSWDGPNDDPYSRMKYDHGLSCWNGPARSTLVQLSCGAENKLTSVSEPNKCVYLFEFETPAVCTLSNTESMHEHEEL